MQSDPYPQVYHTIHKPRLGQSTEKDGGNKKNKMS